MIIVKRCLLRSLGALVDLPLLWIRAGVVAEVPIAPAKDATTRMLGITDPDHTPLSGGFLLGVKNHLLIVSPVTSHIKCH